MTVSVIVAVAANGVIGVDDDLPWRLPKDLREFKRRTLGHHLVMGRRTFEGVGALPGRTTIVVSRGAPDLPQGVVHAKSLDAAIAHAELAGDAEVFIGGGGEIYRLALPLAHRLYLTRVHVELDGDTYFPDLDDSWTEVCRRDVEVDERHAYPFTFHVYERATRG